MALDGKKIAEEIRSRTKFLIKKYHLKPGLAVILIGKNPGSLIYTKLKQKSAKAIGIKFEKFIFPSNVKQKKVIDLIKKLNKDKKIHGIIVQLPVPLKIDPDLLVKTISPLKDVDGFGLKTKFISPVHQGIVKLIKQSRVKTRNKKAVILGNSPIFTRHLKEILESRGLKTFIFYAKKQKFIRPVRTADFLIVALGLAYFIKPKMVKKNAVIIDVGYNLSISGKEKKFCGDVDPSVNKKTPYLSPVPGGIGPLTVAFLLRNTYLAARTNLYNRKK